MVQTYAGYEYLDQIASKGKAPLNGAMQCFCEDQRDTTSKIDWYIKKGYQKDFDIKNFKGEEISEPICKNY